MLERRNSAVVTSTPPGSPWRMMSALVDARRPRGRAVQLAVRGAGPGEGRLGRLRRRGGWGREQLRAADVAGDRRGGRGAGGAAGEGRAPRARADVRRVFKGVSSAGTDEAGGSAAPPRRGRARRRPDAPKRGASGRHAGPVSVARGVARARPRGRAPARARSQRGPPTPPPARRRSTSAAATAPERRGRRRQEDPQEQGHDSLLGRVFGSVGGTPAPSRGNGRRSGGPRRRPAVAV